MLIYLTLCLSLLAFPKTPSPLESEVIYLAPGETLTIPTLPRSTVRVEKRGHFRIHDEGSGLRLVGRKKGVTNLHVDKQRYQIHVLSRHQWESLSILQEWLANKRGLDLRVEDGKVHLTGRLLALRDLLSLQDLPQQVEFINQTQIHPDLSKAVENWLENHLSQQNLYPGQIDLQHGWKISLARSAKNQLTSYRHFLRPFGIQVQLDPHALTQKPVVEIQVFIAHLKSHFARQWGIEWPAAVTAQVAFPTSNSASLQAEDLLISLKALEGQGQGQVLATPTLLAESGAEAHFHSGGEFPIRTTTQFNNNVQWKRYGLFLKTRPQVNALGHLSIELDIEMSSLDQNQSTDGVPALLRSQIRTHLNLKQMAPIVVSGFLKEERSRGSSGLPWLKQIPLLQPLFSSGQIYNDELDLVFILLPKIKET